MGTFAGRLANAKLSRAHLAAALVAGKRVERQRWERLKAIDGYATSDRCRRETLLRYFGDAPARPLPEPCCDRCGWTPVAGDEPLPTATAPVSTRRGVAVDVEAAIFQAVDETAGAVGRTRLSQILRGSSGKALRAAGHDALGSYGALAGMTDGDVLAAVDRLIAAGTLEKTDGFYPLVRRPAAAPRRAAATARDAGQQAQIADLGRRRDREGVPFLARVLAAAERDEQRRLAARALGEIGDERARPALVSALDDTSDDVRRAAAAALDALGRESRT
jgi:ATP-dependent DNA helicase RecQ